MAPPAPTVTITGTFADLGGNVVPGGTVTATLTGYGASIPTVSGAILETLTFSAAVGSNGVFTLTLYGNDVIQPTNVTFYQLQIPGSNGGFIVKPYRFAGSGTFDLSQLVPLGSTVPGRTPPNSATPAVFSPIAHQFITGMNSEGQLSSAQPTLSDLSNASTSAVLNWNGDTGLSRDAAGVIDVGNGTQGNASGTVKADTFVTSQISPVFKVAGTGVTIGPYSLRWSATDANSAVDVGISRTSLGSIAIGNGIAGDATGNLLLNRIVQYFGVLTAGIGTAPIYSIVTSTAQTASIGSTTLYAVPVGGAGLYRVSYSLVTTSAGTGGTAGLTINWNNGSNTASSGSGTITLQTLGSEVTTTLLLESGASQNITYSTTVSGATGNPQYSLRIRLEYLG